METGVIDVQKFRDISMLSSPLFVRILAAVQYELVENHAWAKSAVKAYFERLVKHTAAPAHANSIWKKYAPEAAFKLDTWQPNHRRKDASALVKTITNWAIMDEPFLDADPLPAPVPEIDPDDALDFAMDFDPKLIELELRGEIEEIAKAGKNRARSVKNQ